MRRSRKRTLSSRAPTSGKCSTTFGGELHDSGILYVYGFKSPRLSKSLFGFAVLLTWAHLRPGIFNLSVQFRSFIEIYMSYRYVHVMICMSMMTCSSDQHVDASNACQYTAHLYHFYNNYLNISIIVILLYHIRPRGSQGYNQR